MKGRNRKTPKRRKTTGHDLILFVMQGLLPYGMIFRLEQPGPSHSDCFWLSSYGVLETIAVKSLGELNSPEELYDFIRSAAWRLLDKLTVAI